MWTTWLDAWDERKAAAEDSNKLGATTVVGADLAFPGAPDDESLSSFIARSANAVANSDDYYAASLSTVQFERQGDLLRFRSPVTTDLEANNTAYARIAEGRRGGNAVVIFPHWNAKKGYGQLLTNLSRLGLTAVELTLPYHGRRSRSGSAIADDFLSSNIGRTVQSVRQSVIDGRCVVEWLKREGYGSIAVIGMSLGSCVAGLVGAHDKRVQASALLLTAGDFADVVWTGRATRHIRQTFERDISLEMLQKAWAPISTRNFIPKFNRDRHDLLILSGRRDEVVKPPLTKQFADELAAANVSYRWHELGCGHYSMAIFPYNVVTFARLALFFRSTGML